MISEKIFEILKEKNITQKEFSKLTGIPEGTISDWKRKGLNPGAERIPVICDALGVTPENLLDMNIDYALFLDEDEKLLINSYRQSDAMARERLNQYAIKLNRKIVDVSDDSFAIDDELNIKKQLVRRLRKLARLDRIQIDESEHTSGLNLHLLKYLDFIGLDKLEFIKGYLVNIQPFMVTEYKNQEKFAHAICVLDEYYRISIYIKVDARRGEEIIVSFHENNKNGIAKRNTVAIRNSLVYVLPDSIGSYIVGTDVYTINLFITRGVRTFPLNIAAKKCDDEGFWVKYVDINNALVELMNRYIEDLYTADFDYSDILKFTSLQELSFTSYGNDVFSNISLLIDSLLIQKDTISKQIADAALCIYCSTVSVTMKEQEELLDTLDERFKVNSVRILPEIIERVKLNLIA